MNKCVLVALLGILAFSSAHAGKVADGLIASIGKATAIKCVCWTLVLNGDEIYCLVTDKGENVYVMSKCAGPRGDFAFVELRFSTDEKIENYVLKGDLGEQYSKLKKMIEAIRLQEIEDRDVRRSLPHLIKRLE